MNKRFSFIQKAFLGFILLAVLATTYVIAAEKKKWTFHIGLNGCYLDSLVKGDFAGDLHFDAGDEIMIVPSIKGNYGYGAAIGLRYSFGTFFIEALSVDFIHRRSSHTYSILSAESEKASIQEFGFSVKGFFLRKRFFQPFAYLSAGGIFLNVDNGSFTLSPPLKTGTVKYNGVDIGFGAGLQLYLPAHFSVYGAAGYHFIILEKVTGVLDEKYDIEKVTGGHLQFKTGVIFSFSL